MSPRILKTASSLVLFAAGACALTLARGAPQSSSAGTATTATSKPAAKKTQTTAKPATLSTHKQTLRTASASTVRKPIVHTAGSSTGTAKGHGATSTSAAASKTSTARKAGTHGKAKRPLTGKQRLARLHLESDRVREIQQALAREGYLHNEPSGIWDEQTHAAMLRYQNDHGFSPTGLPDAKSLMKLGLGPHPLPADLDPTLARTASPGTTTTDAPPPSAPQSTQQDETPPPENP